MKRLDFSRLPKGWAVDGNANRPDDPYLAIYDTRMRETLRMGVRSFGVTKNNRALEVGEILSDEVWSFRTQAIDVLRLCLVDDHQEALDEAKRLNLLCNCGDDAMVVGPSLALTFHGQRGFKLLAAASSGPDGKDFARFIVWLTKNGYTEV